MITISGLSKTQVEMLNHMWTIDSEESFLEWQATLSGTALKNSKLLRRMVALAILDQEVEQTNVFPDATNVLNKFRI